MSNKSPTVLILKGLPGSGKSTYAKSLDNNWVRTNKDDLREMLFGSTFNSKQERMVCKMRDAIIIEALLSEKNVVVDDTNFNPVHEARIREIVAEVTSSDLTPVVEVKLIDTDLKTCIENDLKRPNSVGEQVIRGMYRQYMAKPAPPKKVYNQLLAECIIVDLDGTLALMGGKRGPYDATKCDDDDVNFPVLDVLTSYNRHLGARVVFVSGREEKFRPQTLSFLNKKCGLFNFDLFMRPTGDSREDSIVKQEIYEREIEKKWNVQFVMDDRQRVVDMWRNLGLTVFQVAPGDF